MFVKPLALAAALTAAGLAAGPAPAPVGRSADEAAAADLARLQGEWDMVALDVNGYRASEAQVRSWLLVVEGVVYNPGAGEHSVEYTLRLDPTRTPKAIDLISHEGPHLNRAYRGIYAIEGDVFTVTRVLDPDDDRPAGFTSRKGSGTTRVVWRRRPRAAIRR